MVEDTVRDAASGLVSDADIVSAWQDDFKQQRTLAPTAAKITLTLPTGKQVKAIRMPLILLMQAESIPDKLTHMVSHWIELIEQTGGDAQQVQEGLQAEYGENPVIAAQKWIDLVNFVFMNCVVTPTFVDNADAAKPDEGIFYVGAVNFYDKLWLFQWAQGADQSVQSFLDEQTAYVGIAPDGPGVRPTAEQLLASGYYGDIMASLADRPGDVDVGTVHPRQNRRDRRAANRQERKAKSKGAEVQQQADHGLSDQATADVRATEQSAA
jgi:hypothetical protein